LKLFGRRGQADNVAADFAGLPMHETLALQAA